MLYIKSPEEQAKEMKSMAKFLHTFTPPKHPADDDISWLKQREMIVDGCPIVVHYSEADYGDVRMDILTISSKYVPFITFNVICNTVKLFLSGNPTLFEHTKNERKIYSWMVVNRKGKPVEDFQMEKSEKQNYNGFNFYRANINAAYSASNLTDI